MTFICYAGQPLEFWAEYEGKLIKFAGGPDESEVWAIRMENISLNPLKVSLGKGLSAEPNLPEGISLLGKDLELIVKGQGLPANGEKVTFNWVDSSCLYAKVLKGVPVCRQWLGVQAIDFQSGSCSYRIDFIGGYTEKTLNQGKNQAYWRICYDGPYIKSALVAEIPAFNNIGRLVWGLKLLSEKLEEGVDANPFNYHLRSIPVIDHYIITVTSIPDIPYEIRYALLKDLQALKVIFNEINSLTESGNEMEPNQAIRKLRRKVLIQIEKAEHLLSVIIELIENLNQGLTVKRT